MKRQALEKYQALVYLIAIGSGLAVGVLFPEQLQVIEVMLRPVLAFLLYTIFTQTPLVHIRQSISNARFIIAAVIGNFLVVPVLVWGLVQFLPNELAIRLGVFLVLLVPCTDWFITFTHLGGGDTKYAIAFSPISLLLQMLLLPFYLLLFLGETFTIVVARREMLTAFVSFIALPLLGAFLTQKWVRTIPLRYNVMEKVSWFPIPLLAVVVFIIAATQVNLITGSLHILGKLLWIYVAYLIVAGLIALILASVFRLPPSQGRILAFSLGTRNSFVVLPLALSLPASFGVTVVAIVFQSLIELIGMIAYLWLIPKKLFPDATFSVVKKRAK